MNKGKYDNRGVSSQKEDVHTAIKNMDKGVFPNAFCKILPNYFSDDNSKVLVMHADGAGTKSSLAYMYWKETGDMSVWKGIAQDALIMNIDDLLCVGATGPFIISSTIGRNKFLIPGDVISSIINGFNDTITSLQDLGIKAYLAGGETADVGDLVKTVIADSTVFTALNKKNVIENHIQPGDVIVGFASYGKAIYEKEYNSGIGSNGLTFARHELFHHSLAQKYPESYDPHIPEQFVYSGKYQLTDTIPGLPVNIGKMVLSPTRTYAPLILKITQECKGQIHSMIHCTGGGQTKVMHFINKLHIIKNNLFEVPPVFQLIQETSHADWKEMYSVFNMGHRLEIYTSSQAAKKMITISNEFGIDAKIIGYCEQSTEKKLTLHTPEGEIIYL